MPFQAWFRHLSLKNLGRVLVVNLLTSGLVGGSLGVPLSLAGNLPLSFTVLVGGLILSGLAIALGGRWLDGRFRPQESKFRLGAGLAEGLVVGALLLGLFSLAFDSLPYYLAQGGFGYVALGVLALGLVLVLAASAYYLPVRRGEGLGIFAAMRRSVELMNGRPGLAAIGLGLGVFTVAATLVTLGLFPGLGGLAALHQALYERAVKPRS